MSRTETLTSLLARWDELREQGHEIGAEELCADCSDLLPELKVRIEKLKEMDWLDSPDRLLESDSHPSISGEQPELALSPSSVPATLGGRYQVESLIAEGGFAQVWRAKDTLLERPVAIKVTTVNCYSEARRVAQLRHHGIITVHDVGNENGLCYIVFDLVEGATLADKIRSSRPDWQESVRIVAEVAQSLQFAHDKGFIHRDIKPSNILIDAGGNPVLADFGIAVTECELRHEAVTTVGTLAYMAPEQLRIKGEIDARTDVYGLGVVLYELLTGRLPFSSRTFSGLRDAILHADPTAPKSLNPAIPDECERICLKCLSRDSANRYPSAAGLADDLFKCLASDKPVEG